MMSYFGLREWKFSNNNIDQLIKSMKFSKKSTSVIPVEKSIVNGEARQILEFDMKAIDWNEYFVNYLPGITKYFFKESSKNQSNRANQYRRYLLTSFFMILVV